MFNHRREVSRMGPENLKPEADCSIGTTLGYRQSAVRDLEMLSKRTREQAHDLEALVDYLNQGKLPEDAERGLYFLLNKNRR